MLESNRALATSRWARIRQELRRSRPLRRADVGGDASIHPAWCTCRSCQQRDAFAYARRRRALQIWMVLFIGLGAALYGLVFASLPQIAAAFGWRF